MASPSLSQDLKSLREQKGVTLATIIDKTGIQPDIIEQLESGELFTNKRFNNIYVEAITKSYAGFVGVSQGDALQAAKQALSDTYTGLIAENYSENTAPKSESKKTKKSTSVTETVVEPKKPLEEKIADKPIIETVATPSAVIEDLPTTSTHVVNDEKTFSHRLAEARRDNGLGSGYDNDGNGMVRWITILGGFAILVGIAYFAYDYFRANTAAVASNTEQTPQVVQKPEKVVSLPDSFKVEILATQQALSGIQITNDGFTRARIDAAGKEIEPPVSIRVKNLPRPAWIEKGEGIRVFTKDSLRISNPTGAQIKVNGKIWNYTPAPSVLLTRKDAEGLMK